MDSASSSRAAHALNHPERELSKPSIMPRDSSFLPLAQTPSTNVILYSPASDLLTSAGSSTAPGRVWTVYTKVHWEQRVLSKGKSCSLTIDTTVAYLTKSKIKILESTLQKLSYFIDLITVHSVRELVFGQGHFTKFIIIKLCAHVHFCVWVLGT